MNEKMTCIGCKKEPEEIFEYRAEAAIEGVTPTQWVKENEAHSCWGPNSRNKFYCTDCYISAGMPLRK